MSLALRSHRTATLVVASAACACTAVFACTDQELGFEPMTFQSLELTAAEDATVSSGSPTRPLGIPLEGGLTDHIVVGVNVEGWWGGTPPASEMEGLLRFNLGALPRRARLLRATLVLTESFTSGTRGTHHVTLGAADRSWSEETVTWETRPTSSPILEFSDCSECTLIVTRIVEDWVHGLRPNFGFTLRLRRKSDFFVGFHSRERGLSDLRPRLIIEWE